MSNAKHPMLLNVKRQMSDVKPSSRFKLLFLVLNHLVLI